MTLVYHLILTHFLADYPFQPGRLVKYKYKSFWGILIHTVIHLTIISLTVFPFLQNSRVIWGVAIIFITHNLIDYTKVAIDKKKLINGFVLYLADQITHLIVVLGVAIWLIGDVSPWIAGPWFHYYSDIGLVNYLTVLVLATFFFDVTRWTYANTKKKHPYKRGYKLMIKNAIGVTIIFAGYFILMN